MSVLKKKKRYTDQEVTDAIKFAESKGCGYWDLSIVHIYRFTYMLSNKECIDSIENALNNKGYSLFEE